MSFDDINKPENAKAIDAERYAALRSKAEAHVGKEVAAYAKLMDLGESTLRDWIKGTYLGNYDKTAAKVETYFRTLEDKATFMQVAKPAFMKNTVSSRIHTQLAWAHAGHMTTVAGDSGVGKTSALVNYAETRTNVWIVTGSDALSTTLAILKRLVTLMRLPVRTYGVGLDNMTIAIRDYVKHKGALIIVDEIQFLKDGAIEELRAIHDETGVGIALVGQRDVIAGGAGAIKGAQLRRRTASRVTIDVPDTADVNALLDAWGVTDSAMRSFMAEIGLMPGLGALGAMTTVLEYASMMARQAEQPLNIGFIQHAAAHHGLLVQLKRKK
ncbi:AAA family ATPase [Asticcacaulis sp. YBE204]|uniref:AAA family ATPase n=1 Tax=Asticcacaulis sp. YBE204 TaxID=1282363 RepID=UPI0003C3F217|nr:AAA family ATPase [Asticcacaulis sp. YBE204]ESQ78481.1 hypothetical protein AEYBE204_13075 [Asticcacaulis sp. YBE204]